MAKMLARGQKQTAARSKTTIALAVIAGLAFGGGGASAWFLLNGRLAAPASAAPDSALKPLIYVNIPRLTVPISDDRGNMLGYVTLDLALEVPTGREEYVKQHIPMIRHGLNALLFGSGSLGKVDQPEQLDIKRATPAMLKAANAALEEPIIKSLSIITALPS
jgi:flagellar basal body-associated protein FliL